MGRVARIAAAAIALVGVTGAAAGSASAAPVSVGISGWTWGNPVPQGETLNRVAFQGATGYAAGEDGTVLRSNDGGATWAGLSSGSRSNFTILQEVDPNTVVVGGGCTVRESTDGGASFHRLPVNEAEQGCATKVAAVSFLTGTTGYVEQSDGSVLLTEDAGQTLQPKTGVPLNGATPGQMLFVSPTFGFAIASGPSGGKIYRTTDGAGSWTQVGSAPQALSDIEFVSPTLAYAVGGAGTLLNSMDGGATWSALPLVLPAGAARPALTQISCSDAEHCLIATAPVAGPGTNVLVRTTDGGATGTLVSASSQNLLSVAFSAASDAVAVGAAGATVLSTDGGATFPTSIAAVLGATLDGAIRLGRTPGSAFVPGHGGQIAATVDGGASWSLLRVPTSSNIVDVAFPGTAGAVNELATNSVGYAVSEAGIVYRTNNGGISWAILNSGGGEPTALLAPGEATVVLTGPTGMRLSANGGASFAPVSGSVVVGKKHGKILRRQLSAFPLDSGAEMAGSAMIAWGDEAIESTDRGAHWTLIPRPLKHGGFESLSFVTPTTGYAVSFQRLFFTRNAGRTWKEISSAGEGITPGQGSIAFSSVSAGYALWGASEGEVLRTSDGGRTWIPEQLPRKVEMVAAGGAVDFAMGGSALFATTTGGLNPTSSKLTLAIAGPSKLSRKKLRRAHERVKLKGVLSPAQGGEKVRVSCRGAGRSLWSAREVTVASDGAFSVTVPGIHATTDCVAQWSGGGAVSGAGTPAVELRVTKH
jgi:photosystem II stability/assembly factor-like uncharacterized protein